MGLLGKFWKGAKKYSQAKKDPKVASFLEDQLFDVKGSASEDDRSAVWKGVNKRKMLGAFGSGKKQFMTAWKNVLDPKIPRDQVKKEWTDLEKEYDFFKPGAEKTFLSSISNPDKQQGFSTFNKHLTDKGYIQKNFDDVVQKNNDVIKKKDAIGYASARQSSNLSRI